MAGYVLSTRKANANPRYDWNTKWGLVNNMSSSSAPQTMDESVRSFRSGSRYRDRVDGGSIDKIETSTNGDYSRNLGDTGHIFELSSGKVQLSHPHVKWTNPLGTYAFEGPAHFDSGIRNSQLKFNPMLAPTKLSQAVVNGYGTQAVASAAPTAPQADILTALIELLREGLPSALFSAIAGPVAPNKRAMTRKLASDYLSYMFGFSPLIREAANLLDLVENASRYVEQLLRDSGNVVRRRRVLLDETNLVASASTRTGPSLMIQGGTGTFNAGSSTIRLVPNNTEVTAHQTLKKKVWFSGAFQYWIPFEGEHQWNGLSSLDVFTQIAGLRSMRSTAWELTPFSWLVDWFGNVGSVLQNRDLFDQYGLVMPYAYVMCEQQLVTTYTFDMRNPNSGYPSRGVLHQSYVTTTKQRARATPYGFGVKESDLNPIQISILAALGITGGRKQR